MTGRRWRAPAALLCGALLVVVAACGDDGADTKADGTTTSTTAEAGSPSGSSTTRVDPPASTTTELPGLLTLTPDSYGALKIGMTFAQAKATGMIGDVGAGCEVASPPTQGARMVEPLMGGVSGLENTITAIDVRSRFITSPGGIQKGDSLAKVQAAFAGYEVKVDKTTEDVFGEWVVDVLDGGHQLFAFTVDPASQGVDAAAVPSIQFCD